MNTMFSTLHRSLRHLVNRVGPNNDVPKTDSAVGRFGEVVAMALIGVSLVFRILWLDRVPGVNGDEAWYGVQAVRFVDGKTWSWQTPSGLPVNPMLFVTEVLLLKIWSPSFLILRIPIAIWACAGLAITFVLHRWYSGSRGEALLVVALTGCMPAHLAYSRFCWDSSFAFVAFPLVLYPFLRIVQGVRSIQVVLLLFAGTLLCLWVHVTHAILIVAAALIWAWNARSALATPARRRPITSTALVLIVAGALVLVFRKQHAMRILIDSATSSLDRFPLHLKVLADLFAGMRIYDYLAGLPSTGSAWWTVPVFCLMSVVILLALLRSGDTADRSLALLALLSLLLIFLTGRAFRLDDASYERYFLYAFPLSAVVLVRGVRVVMPSVGSEPGKLLAALPLVLAVCFLVQFWFCYFAVIRSQAFDSRLHQTFHTGTREPKAELASALSERLQRESHAVIYTENWWLHHSVDYLLRCRYEVRRETIPVDSTTQSFVVGFAESGFVSAVRDKFGPLDGVRRESQFGNSNGQPILLLLEIGSPGNDGETVPDQTRD